MYRSLKEVILPKEMYPTYLFTHVYTNTYKVKCYIHYKTYTKIEHFKGWVKIIVNRSSTIHFSHSSGAQAHQHENHCTSQ